MTNEELDREIERAARNAKKLASLAAENERTAHAVAAVLSPRPRMGSAVRTDRIAHLGVRA
jgi:hypothetical protein